MYQISSVGVPCCNEEKIRQGVFNWNQDPRIENIKIVCVGGRSSDGALKIWNVFFRCGAIINLGCYINGIVVDSRLPIEGGRW